MKMDITDNGNGYKGNFKKTTNTLGFQLIQSLTEQLNGTLIKKKTKLGTHYTLTFERM